MTETPKAKKKVPDDELVAVGPVCSEICIGFFAKKNEPSPIEFPPAELLRNIRFPAAAPLPNPVTVSAEKELRQLLSESVNAGSMRLATPPPISSATASQAPHAPIMRVETSSRKRRKLDL